MPSGSVPLYGSSKISPALRRAADLSPDSAITSSTRLDALRVGEPQQVSQTGPAGLVTRGSITAVAIRRNQAALLILGLLLVLLIGGVIFPAVWSSKKTRRTAALDVIDSLLRWKR